MANCSRHQEYLSGAANRYCGNCGASFYRDSPSKGITSRTILLICFGINTPFAVTSIVQDIMGTRPGQNQQTYVHEENMAKTDPTDRTTTQELEDLATKTTQPLPLPNQDHNIINNPHDEKQNR